MKEEDFERYVSTVWIRPIPIPSCTFEQFKATLEENTLILHCKTTCCYRGTGDLGVSRFPATVALTKDNSAAPAKLCWRLHW